MFGETSNAFTRNIQKFYTVCKFITSPSGRAQSVHFFTFNTAICNARLLFLLQNYDGCRRLKQKNGATTCKFGAMLHFFTHLQQKYKAKALNNGFG